jgi:hypothetical protein
VAINSAHLHCNKLTIGLAKRNRNMAYHLGSAFNQMIKKLNRNKGAIFAKQNEVHHYDAMATPCIMVTHDSGDNGHNISKQDQRKTGLPILHPST